MGCIIDPDELQEAEVRAETVTRYLCAVLSYLENHTMSTPLGSVEGLILPEAELAMEGVEHGEIVKWWRDHKRRDDDRITK